MNDAAGWRPADGAPAGGNAADWLLRWLADQGVEIIFGNPGSTELPLIDALTRQHRIRYVLGLHEAAVMGMADGYAQQGHRLAVVNLHVQPGLANGMAGILNARRARVPMLVTVGQQVTALKDRGPFLGGDVVAMATPLAKDVVELDVNPRVHGEQLGRARAAALAHPQGPVVVSLPADILVGPPARCVDGIGWGHQGTDAGDVAAAAALLGAARHPVVLAGDGVVHEQCVDEVIALAERLGAPILGEPFAARFPVPAAHPLWQGPLPGFAAQIAPVLAGYDVVFAVGMPVFRLFGPSPGDLGHLPARLIHLDPDADEIGRSVIPRIKLPYLCAPTIAAVLAELGATTAAWRERCDTVAARILLERDEAERRLVEASEAPAIAPVTLCRAIARAVAPDDLVVDEALTAGRWLRTALGARNRPDNWLAHRGSALGWGLPAAVGAKLADPTRRVLCVHGDGSFLFGAQALWTAAHERLGVALVIADNGGYEILRAGLEGLTGRADDAWPGLALRDPPIDLCAIARGYGASAERVADPTHLDAALGDLWERSRDRPGVLVVAVTGRTGAVGYPIDVPAP